MAEVDRTVTPITAREATALMMAALSTREDAPAPVAQHLLSLVWIETGAGQKMVCHNWGNLSGAYSGNYWRPAWYEVDESSSARLKELHARMLAGRAPSKFRAYSSRGEGLDDYLSLLYSSSYAPMLTAARAGDTRAFADAVHDTGYCPDDECRGERTYPSYQRLTRQFGSLLGLQPVSPAAMSSDHETGLGRAVLPLALLWVLAKGGFKL